MITGLELCCASPARRRIHSMSGQGQAGRLASPGVRPNEKAPGRSWTAARAQVEGPSSIEPGTVFIPSLGREHLWPNSDKITDRWVAGRPAEFPLRGGTGSPASRWPDHLCRRALQTKEVKAGAPGTPTASRPDADLLAHPKRSRPAGDAGRLIFSGTLAALPVQEPHNSGNAGPNRLKGCNQDLLRDPELPGPFSDSIGISPGDELVPVIVVLGAHVPPLIYMVPKQSPPLNVAQIERPRARAS